MDPGKKINNMEMALRLGQMVLHMMDFMMKGKNMAMENSLGLTVALMKGNFKIIILKGKVNINGVINDFITEIGKTIRWKVTEFSNGLMVVNTKEHIETTRKKVMEHSSGRMVVNIPELG